MSEKKMLKRREFVVNGVVVPVMANDDEVLADVKLWLSCLYRVEVYAESTTFASPFQKGGTAVSLRTLIGRSP
jgi:hypothetical protein